MDEAREALAYWEDRSHRLPRHAVRRRREARAMAARWSVRVAEAERERYGRGILGALLLVALEGRVPENARRSGRRLARRAGQGLALAGVACLAVMVLAVTVVVELVAAIV